jgi:hypothetical protein
MDSPDKPGYDRLRDDLLSTLTLFLWLRPTLRVDQSTGLILSCDGLPISQPLSLAESAGDGPADQVGGSGIRL